LITFDFYLSELTFLFLFYFEQFMSMPITRSEAKVARTYECEHCHGFFSRQGISAHEAACLKTRTPFYVPETPPPPPAPVLMAS
jgi:hypothetical protein